MGNLTDWIAIAGIEILTSVKFKNNKIIINRMIAALLKIVLFLNKKSPRIS